MPVSVAEKNTFTSIAHQMVNARLTQKYKYNFSYVVSTTVNPAQTRPVFLTITQDADFLFEKMTGSAYGPVDSSGIPQQSATDFPMPGIAIGQGFAGRGLAMQLIDTGNTRNLTSGFIPVETVLSPGYGTQMYLPYPIKYFAKRNSRIQFDFRNQDTQARHQVTVVVNGYKFQMPEDQANLEVNKSFEKNAEVAR